MLFVKSADAFKRVYDVLTTRQKIRLARIAAAPVRWFAGRHVQVRRQQITWQLDLNEGIDFSIYLFGGFEPATLRAYRQAVCPGFVVFDVGANIGAHTLPLAQLVGPSGFVVAFEPTDYAFSKLCRNLEFNPALSSHIRAERLVLLDSTDATPPVSLASSWPLRPDDNAHHRHGGIAKSISGARATTLDEYAATASIERVDLIKLDVDGNELPILQGAVQVIAQFRPIIVFELAPYVMKEAGTRETDLLGLLRAAGYEFARSPTGAALQNDGDSLIRAIPDGASLNLWARPK